MSIQIISDTGHNLPSFIADKIPMIEVPFKVIVGDDIYDDNEITLAFLAGLLERRKSQYPTTSAPSIGAFLVAFQACHASDGILVISIGSNFSTTYEVALQAKERYAEEGGRQKIEVVDSKGGTMSQGFLIMEANKMIGRGTPLAEVATRLRTLAETRANLLFTVRETTYLYRSGRAPRATHGFASVFRIKPVLSLSNGHLLQAGRVRTEIRAIERVADIMLAQTKGEMQQLAIIGGYGTEKEEDQLRELLRGKTSVSVDDAIVAKLCPAMMVHVGPHAVGVSWW